VQPGKDASLRLALPLLGTRSATEHPRLVSKVHATSRLTAPLSMASLREMQHGVMNAIQRHRNARTSYVIRTVSNLHAPATSFSSFTTPSNRLAPPTTEGLALDARPEFSTLGAAHVFAKREDVTESLDRNRDDAAPNCECAIDRIASTHHRTTETSSHI
jgi:hypothetical protein